MEEKKLAIHDFLTLDEQKLLIDLNPDTLMLVTPQDGRIVYSNRPRPHLAMPELLGSSYLDLVRPGNRKLMQQALEQSARELVIVERDIELEEGGDQYSWSRMLLIPVVREGKPYYILVILTDVSELKNAIGELKASRQRLQDHLDHTPLAAMMWDADQVTVEWNPAAEKIFGYSREEAIGRQFTELIVPRAEWQSRREQFARALETGMIHKYPPYTSVTKSGREVICEWFSTTIKNADGQVVGIASLAQDITEQIQAKMTLEQAKQAAEESAHAKASFLANMSHEIRTPMNGILGMIELMWRDDLNEEQLAKLDVIHQSTQTLLTILNDILDFSKIESNAMMIETIPVDLNNLLQQVVGLMRPAAEKKGLAINSKLLDKQYSQIMGDPNRLTQVLSNLLSNAIKFTEQGHVTINTHAQADGNKRRIAIEVIDTGIGIKQEDINTIFQDFNQADVSITRRYGGTGLGLTICQRLASLMNGQITVDSEYDKGSRFVFEFSAEAASMAAEIGRFQQASIEHFNGHVLLVDDNQVNLQVGAKMLETLGLEVSCADSGRQALRLAGEKTDIDLILMDIHMPEMNGLQAATALRQMTQYRDTPIVAVTANVLDEERQHCLSAGMDGFLAKPFSLLQLSTVIGRWLD